MSSTTTITSPIIGTQYHQAQREESLTGKKNPDLPNMTETDQKVAEVIGPPIACASIGATVGCASCGPVGCCVGGTVGCLVGGIIAKIIPSCKKNSKVYQ